MGVVDELLGMISEPTKKLMNDICREYDAHALEQSRIIGEYQNVCITLKEQWVKANIDNGNLQSALDYALLTAPEKGPGWSTRIRQMSRGERRDDACSQEEAQSATNKVLADFFRLAVLAYDRGVYEHEIRAICDGREP